MAEIDYPAHLNMMWQKAIAPRETNAPTVISTFAGGGGSLTGYMMAGFNDLLAVEWDSNAVETLRLNWPKLDIYHGDIAKITVEDILQRTGLKVGVLDILDGSPPCQGFSTAGKRVIDDPRNQLFREYVRLLRGLQPKVFVMENVSGMVKGKMKLVFVEILKELKASGYKVSAKLLNAMYFHVPQSRQRMIFIGVREDLGVEPSHPKAEGKPITVGRAIGHYNNMQANEKQHIWKDEQKSKTYPLAQRAKQGETYVGQKKRDYWNKPSATLQKLGVVKYPNLRRANCHPIYTRTYSLRESACLGSFPENYLFSGKFEGVDIIGNSVPPLFMEAIARHIRTEILDRAITPELIS